MKPNTTSDGLSARRRIIGTAQPHSCRRPVGGGVTWMFVLVASLLGAACQEKVNGQAGTQPPKDSTIKPKVSIKVNRRYDEKGHVTGYDSTYTSFYSNVPADTGRINSLFNFDPRVGTGFAPFVRNPRYFNDSLHYPDLLRSDYFRRSYERNNRHFRSMMQEMDSMRHRLQQEPILQRKKS